MIAKGNVEVWIGDLLKEQMKSLHGVIKEAHAVINDQSFELLNFIDHYQAQVMLHVIVNYSPIFLYTIL